jgi:hypothetical protein
MKKITEKVLLIIFSIIMTQTFFSCSRKEGYAAVLWAIPEYHIQDGDIVPVYSKSNIIHKYVIGTPGGEKIEIPLWQITEPASKHKSKKLYNKISEYNHKYASVKLDGLPCRNEAKNLAKQVYRLRKGEVVKVLRAGQGEPVMKGKEELPGEWLRILTKDGTQGWCYSYNLNVYDLDEQGNQIGGEVIATEDMADETFESIYDKSWYPEKYAMVIGGSVVDTTIVKLDYGFSIDTEKEKVSISVPENKDANIKAFRDSWTYKGYEKKGRNQYVLTGLPLTVTVRKENVIAVRYSAPSGKPRDYVFITLDEKLEDILKAERERRSSLYSKIVNKGPNYVSTSYGNLNFTSSYTFSWTGFDALSPVIIPDGVTAGGSVSYKYVVDKSLAEQYDGVLTFKFDGAAGKEVNFLFKIESEGLRLEDASNATFIDGRITKRSPSSVIIYFKSN